MKAPAGVYFSGDLSITVWIKIASDELSLAVSSWHLNIVNFGNINNNMPSDSVIFQLQNGILSATIYRDQNFSRTVNTTSSINTIKFGVWNHVAFTLDGYTGFLYLNGTLIGSNSKMIAPISATRSLNNVAQSSSNVYVTLDDLKFFKLVLD